MKLRGLSQEQQQILAGFPGRQGLYDPRQEKDSCGLGLVVHVPGGKSHEVVQDALQVLRNLHHRGAQGADSRTGDGCGILTQIPHSFFRIAARECGIDLPEAGGYAVGVVFLPADDPGQKPLLEREIEGALLGEGLAFLGWRDVPARSDSLGWKARSTQPLIRQFFVAREAWEPSEFDRKLYIARRRAERAASHRAFAIVSLSSTTVVYKGLLLPEQLPQFFPDLERPEFKSAIAMVHSRFSTNTFPTWALAHPYRYLCHNGEINTLGGNLNWMKAREGRLASGLFGPDIEKIFPVIRDGQSDSACLDNMLEFLVMGGRPLPHAMMMLIPEPWQGNPGMDPDRRAFYEYHAAMMEPWDGPAAVCFSDGKSVGVTLDRNGLRPCRYAITSDDRVILSSEAGVLPLDPARILRKGRIEPGKMLLIDTERGRIIEDDELKSELARGRPYRAWANQHRIALEGLPAPAQVERLGRSNLREEQLAFGYTSEELAMVLAHMAINGEEPISSMGSDTPLAVLSDRPQLLFNYFRQLFAQVTNPPIDPIREHLVMSLGTYIGPKAGLFHEGPDASKRVKIPQPVLTNSDLAKIREISDPDFGSKTLSALFRADAGPNGLEEALGDLCRQAEEAVRAGSRLLILSDRGVSAERAPIPSLLATAAVHHHLIARRMRTETGLIVESGEPRNVHHFACLIGYGAGAVNPYLAFDSLAELGRDGLLPDGVEPATAHLKFVQAIGKGLLKIFSKMGISTVQSYCGAQIFEALGLGSSVIERYFKGTASRIGGIGLGALQEDCLRRHRMAYAEGAGLEHGGEVHYRAQGERHGWNPETIAKLQHAARGRDARSFREFSEQADREMEKSALRGLFEFQFAAEPLPLSEIEPASEIVRRFTTGAMSLGAISPEAHETLAVAMNRMGAKSNTGEGGEDPRRFEPLPNGDSPSSAIKQIASGRFGVTVHYLANAKEIQIKMAQGAKPGEGGQLPGHKVDETIARLRYSTPGVQLISPPPHHDIYSIEDLAQLIFDLKNANPEAMISVKLVSEVGVGTVAAGVAKAHADKILISGDSGGTGASPLSSIKHAGLPWELGLAETHQTLLLNGLRGRVRLETDGQLRTGRDVVIAALLGAEEFGFATAPLIVEGCIMMRKCHLNTCPVGIATQDPVLRKKFAGRPEHLVNYFFFVAEEARQLMARLGFRGVNEMVGRADKLKAKPCRGLDLSPILAMPKVAGGTATYRCETQDHGLEDVLDRRLLPLCRPAIATGEKVRLDLFIRNTDRSFGTFLSGKIAKVHGEKGLTEDLIRIDLRGSAGQSFGAFLAPGITLKLEGEANDYVGKGLSGGKIIIYPPRETGFPADRSVLIGNTGLYGATSGEVFLAGGAGERFAVRNSGARAVVEGVGDHGCEYMTRGTVVVLGPTGRNFAAGMSGGIAYVLDEDGSFHTRCNPGMVELEAIEDREDELRVLGLLHVHEKHTGSRKAREVLEAWHEYRRRFVRVMPIEYKRALARGEGLHGGSQGIPEILALRA